MACSTYLTSSLSGMQKKGVKKRKRIFLPVTTPTVPAYNPKNIPNTTAVCVVNGNILTPEGLGRAHPSSPIPGMISDLPVPDNLIPRLTDVLVLLIFPCA